MTDAFYDRFCGDLGQPINPPVAEGLAAFAQQFLDAGFHDDEVRHMTVTLPAFLLQGDPVSVTNITHMKQESPV